MKLKVDRQNKKLDLVINDLKDKNLSIVSWDFETLKKASSKMTDLFLVFAEIKTENKKNQYHFTEGEIYKDFDFDKLLKEIEKGGIMFDIRIGVYNSGKNYGKIHDHGSGFRVKAANFKNLYDSYETILKTAANKVLPISSADSNKFNISNSIGYLFLALK